LEDEVMADREKINKHKMIKYSQEKMESDKQKQFFQMLRKEVEIGAILNMLTKQISFLCALPRTGSTF
jgi:hypothetical protein